VEGSGGHQLLQLGEKEGLRFARENGAVMHRGNGSPNEADGGTAQAQNSAWRHFSGAGIGQDAKGEMEGVARV
jgi:hypothetical protein